MLAELVKELEKTELHDAPHEFLRYSQEIKLDPNTVHKHLVFSEGNRKVTVMDEAQSYPDHTDRFTGHRLQVLSDQSLSGRSYWEVEWSGRGGGEGVNVAVTYENISRSGSLEQCGFGFNEESGALVCDQDVCKFGHNNVWTEVSDVRVSRVGVYLDHRAGLLSFYRVSDTRTLIHRVQTRFTQPLYAGLWLYLPGTTAEMCELK